MMVGVDLRFKDEEGELLEKRDDRGTFFVFDSDREPAERFEHVRDRGKAGEEGGEVNLVAVDLRFNRFFVEFDGSR